MTATQRQLVDLTHPLSAAIQAFPGDPPLEIRILDSTAATSVQSERHLNCSHLSLSLHCGTHMDAPFHFFEEGKTIDRVLLDRCIGPALRIRLPADAQTIEPAHLRDYEGRLRATGRVILQTGWERHWGASDYFTEHPVITGQAAQFLLDCGVGLVGVDTPSVDRAPFPAHLIFLGNDVLIIENLTNLDAVPVDEFELIATPLAIAGRDGSPVRAVARF